jgi:hypothetical protein
MARQGLDFALRFSVSTHDVGRFSLTLNARPLRCRARRGCGGGSSWRACAKNIGTDSDACAATFDRLLKVARHAHGQV